MRSLRMKRGGRTLATPSIYTLGVSVILVKLWGYLTPGTGFLSAGPASSRDRLRLGTGF